MDAYMPISFNNGYGTKKLFQENEFENPNNGFDLSPNRKEGGCIFDKNSYSYRDTKRYVDLVGDTDLGFSL